MKEITVLYATLRGIFVRRKQYTRVGRKGKIIVMMSLHDDATFSFGKLDMKILKKI